MTTSHLDGIISTARALQGYDLNEKETAELGRIERDLDALLDQVANTKA